VGSTVKGFVPFGEYKPDLRYFANDGLYRADNVVPVYGGYIPSPSYGAPLGLVGVGPNNGTPQGLSAHQANGNLYAPVSNGVNTRIWQVTPAGVVSDVSRAALYTAPVVPFGGWTGTSFGSHAVLCPEFDEVQYQANGTGLFANMITSTFAPKARFCFALRQNLFLANLNLAAPYDGLPAGANPTVIAWSRSDDIRQFGSFNADPQIIGSGYQPLNFDIGDIRCALAGADYGIIGFSNGIVRVDGPPYTFRVISRDIGMAFPYGACSVRDDIYFMSPAGLAVLYGGEGPARIIGAGKWVRSLIDNSTGFGLHPALVPVGTSLNANAFTNLSMAYDSVNDLLLLAYTISGDSQPSRGLMAYNIAEDRASFFQFILTGNPAGTLFMRSTRQSDVANWMPGRDIRWIGGSSAASQHYLGQPALINGPSPAVSTLQKGYIQLDKEATSRFTRIRPIYHVASAYTGTWSVSIDTANRPSGAASTYGPYTAMDTHGWISTPTTGFGDFHSPKFTLTPDIDVAKVVEIEGFEYEAEVGGPRYAA
jgi:hypothetical protein